jgi:hypothetical protein
MYHTLAYQYKNGLIVYALLLQAFWAEMFSELSAKWPFIITKYIYVLIN